jgi:hypothetical protein
VSLWSLGVTTSGAQTTPGITSPLPPAGTVGSAYLHQFTATTPDLVFSATGAPLPPGLTLASTGFLTGTPTMAGTFGPTTVCGSNATTAPVCQTFTLVIGRRSPDILASASPGGPVGTPVRSTASLIGALLPTGTMTFRLFSDASCTTQVFTSQNVVDVTGAATSSDFVPTLPGTYRWTATYSGDANNNPVTSPCSASNSVTITGTLPSTTSPSSTSLPSSTSSTTTSSTSSTSTTSSSVPTGTTSSSSSSSSSSSTSSTSTSTTVGATSSTTAAPASSSTTATTAATTTTLPTSTSTSTSTSTTTTTIPATTSTTATAVTTVTTAPTVTTLAVPTVSASPQQVTAGQPVTLTGSGFPPGSAVTAQLFSDPVFLGSAVADAGGNLRLVVTIPVGTAPGLHTIRVSAAGTTAVAETTVVVAAPVAVAQVGGATLSRTGANVLGPARMALALVVTGFVLVGWAWKGNGAVLVGLTRRRRRWPDRRRW